MLCSPRHSVGGEKNQNNEMVCVKNRCINYNLSHLSIFVCKKYKKTLEEPDMIIHHITGQATVYHLFSRIWVVPGQPIKTCQVFPIEGDFFDCGKRHLSTNVCTEFLPMDLRQTPFSFHKHK